MASGTCGDNLTWTFDDGTLTISGKGDMSDDWGTVKDKIGNKNIKKVIIGYGVTTIGKKAFRCCDSLTAITIPDSVTTIGDSAFKDCHSLTAITIPEGVTTIGDYAFCYCYSLTAITIPDTVIELGDNIFDNCDRLQKIYYRKGSGFESKLAMGNYAELIPVTTPKNPTWKVNDITLIVGGTDKIQDYSKEKPQWYDWTKTVQKIVIEDGASKKFPRTPSLTV